MHAQTRAPGLAFTKHGSQRQPGNCPRGCKSEHKKSRVEKGDLAAWKENVDSAELQERLKDRALPMKVAHEGHPSRERAAQLTCRASFGTAGAILKIQTSILGASQVWDRLKVDRNWRGVRTACGSCSRNAAPRSGP